MSDEEKARFHQITGAGRSGVLRPFMGVTERDIRDIAEMINEHVGKKLRRAG